MGYVTLLTILVGLVVFVAMVGCEDAPQEPTVPPRDETGPPESVRSALDAFVQELKTVPLSELRSADILTGDAAILKNGRPVLILVEKENLDQGKVAVLVGAQMLVFPSTPPAEYVSFVAAERAGPVPITDPELLRRLRAKLDPDLPGAVKFNE